MHQWKGLQVPSAWKSKNLNFFPKKVLNWLRDAPIATRKEADTDNILIFFRVLIPIPVNSESETWTDKTGFQKLYSAFHIYIYMYIYIYMIPYNFTTDDRKKE